MASSPLRDLLLELNSALDSSGIRYALIGGLALGPRGFPRGTTDVDFLVRGDMIERIRAFMRERGAEVLAEDDDFSSYIDHGIRADFQHARGSRDLNEQRKHLALQSGNVMRGQAGLGVGRQRIGQDRIIGREQACEIAVDCAPAHGVVGRIVRLAHEGFLYAISRRCWGPSRETAPR